ncbi:MAG: DUF3885 domain-containing protein [Segniliparus sp.]|uniref:DUF3885 domain-containing protein n=1 Tax=Segniliparus sp. TaxID=2804064 RepID=UPI003F375256
MIDQDELERARQAWAAHWPDERPIGHHIRNFAPGRHIRFHSLPQSKQYTDTPEELGVLLDRHNTLFGEFFAPDEELFFVFPTVEPADPDSAIVIYGNPVPEETVPGCQLWFRAPPDEDEDFETVYDFHIAKVRWRRGAFDAQLRDVDREILWGVIIADAGFTRLAHPYDGGLDLLVPTEAEALALRSRYREWAVDCPCWQDDGSGPETD